MRISAEARERFTVSPELLWPLLADTERLNRALRLPPVAFAAVSVDGRSALQGELRLGRIMLARWIEHPFDWEAPHHYSVRREYSSGPFRELVGGVELTAIEDGCEVRAWVDLEPRNLVGRLLGKQIVAPRSTRAVLAQCRLFERYLRGEAPSPFPQLRPQEPVDAMRLDALARAMQAQGSDPALVGRLQLHLLTAPDLEVSAIRPFELADRWGIDRRSVLALCLEATLVGLLELRWQVLCPNCRVAKSDFGSLSQLSKDAHCETCQMSFEADFDRLAEVRFKVARAVREVSEQCFCIGGPLNTPHVVANATLEAGETRAFRVRLRPGSYRLRANPGPTLDVRAQQAGPARVAVALDADPAERGPLTTSSSDLELTITNGLATRSDVALESAAWSDAAATGAVVATVPAFRDLFSAEVLAPGLEVAIRRQVFLFTDLAGSTALYEQIGEARAFRLVQEHFQILGRAIAEQHGAVVKTIGDAVMAVFAAPLDGLQAAIGIQHGIRALNCRGAADPARLVRVGIHVGPCVAVTQNERLDYFGTTVNTAARVEHESRGGEIVASAAFCEDPDVESHLRTLPVRVEPFVARLRGLSDEARLVRIRLGSAQG
jgi:adenylate cyclase